MTANYDAAVPDILFFGDRFQNILAFLPELQKMGSFKQAIVELDNQITGLRLSIDNLAKMEAEAKDRLKALQEAHRIQEMATATMVAEAKEKALQDANVVIGEAKEKAIALVKEAKAKREDIQTKISEKEVYLAAVTDQVAAQEKLLQDAKDKLALLKNSL